VSASAAAHPEGGLPTAALAGMLLAASLAPLGSTMIAVALPSIGRDTGADASDLTQWLVSSYLITSIALQSPGGKLGDLIGHGRALLAGLALVAAGGVLGLLVGHLHLLGVARILMASGGAATVPATMAILRNQTSADRRARVFGVFGACMGLAAAIGPLVGGELTERFGWRCVRRESPVVAVSLVLVMLAADLRAGVRGPSVLRLAAACLASGLTLTIVSPALGAPPRGIGGFGVVLSTSFCLGMPRRLSGVDFAAETRRSSAALDIALQNMAMYPLLFQLPVFRPRAVSAPVRWDRRCSR
jgi:MFS family permease